MDIDADLVLGDKEFIFDFGHFFGFCGS